ncbi:MAG: hypothetical protein DME59_14195 [Verrucomicrobia bacterium]|nr:MAG: hypothetical protein DME59_14195 [Verrucomicrobiota bacterium]PYL75031.1 MAG: hypothetical protein DMF26_09355 [Verrucomicrobiota bacterium]
MIDTNVYLYEQTHHPVQSTQKRRKADMKSNKWFKLIGAAVGLMILGFAVPSGQTATTLTLTAVVQNQQCQAGNMVNVTLTIDITPRHPQGVQFQWDFNNDGVFDTPLSPNPTVRHLYPDETNVTAVARAVKGGRHATDSVTFTTLRCGG